MWCHLCRPMHIRPVVTSQGRILDGAGWTVSHIGPMLEEVPAVLADAESPMNICSLGYSADGDNGRSKGMTLWETEKNFRSRSGPEGKFKVSVEIAMEGGCKGEGRSGSSGLGCQVNTISVHVKLFFNGLLVTCCIFLTTFF
jgi:hypothetical protein